jgi:catechol 2,3-dioxygenase-like lactoylglutathione lyase family enzyme
MRRILLLTCLLSLSASSLVAQQQPTRPAITGVAFARFYTTNPDAAERFYGTTLGFQRKQADGMWLYPINQSQWIELITKTPPPQAGNRLAAVAFTTTDAKQLERYLESEGIKPEQPLKKGQFGVRDPEGNLVIFVQKGSEKPLATAPASPNATSTRIIHVGFMVTDQAKEDAFWKGILGFRPYWHGGPKPDVDNWVSIQVPDGTDWLEYMLNNGPNPTLQHAGVMDHFSLGVVSMPDTVVALARNHCEGANCTKSQMGRDGKVQLNLYDPDMTRVEFMEFAPTQEPCCSPFTGKHPTPGDENK